MMLLWVTIPVMLAAIAIWITARRASRRRLITPQELGRLLDTGPAERRRGLPDGEEQHTLMG